MASEEIVPTTPLSGPSESPLSASYGLEGTIDVNGSCGSMEGRHSSISESHGTGEQSPKSHVSRDDTTARTSHTSSLSKEDRDNRTVLLASDKFNSLVGELRSLKVTYMALSSSLSKVEGKLTSEIAANEKRKTIVENSSFTVKKELTTLVRDEVSALKSARAEDLVQIRLEHQKEMETMRKTFSSQSVQIEQLEEEVGRLHLRVGLLDSSCPAFVTVANVSAIADKTFTNSSTFYSGPCGHPMHLSVVKSPQGGLVVMLNIDSNNAVYEDLVAWPVAGRVIVEAIGFPVMEDKDLNRLLVGTIELDEKSGKRGGGGYVGVLSDCCVRDKASVLQHMSQQSGMFKAKDKPVQPHYYIRNDTLCLRVVASLQQR